MAKKNVTPLKSTATIIEPIYQIRNINLIDYALFAPSESVQNAFQFDVKLEQKHQLKESLSLITAILVIKNADEVICGNLSIGCTFSVENLTEIIKHEASIKTLSLKLNQITISTARGVLFGMFRGTVLHHAVLPLVDVAAFQMTA
jgi:hypothetical protein